MRISHLGLALCPALTKVAGARAPAPPPPVLAPAPTQPAAPPLPPPGEYPAVSTPPEAVAAPSGAAHAAAAPPAAQPTAEEPPPAPDPTARHHGGFYLRIGLGGGFMASKIDSPIGTLSARGAGLASEISLGGTVADGLVLGGGMYSSWAGALRWRGAALRASERRDAVTGGQGALGLLGVLVDYYPDPRAGFHVQGALGIGVLTFEADPSTSVPNETWSGSGGGAMLGVGYEGWVGAQWSLGGVARLLLLSGSLRGEVTDRTFGAQGYAPAVMFVATYH